MWTVVVGYNSMLPKELVAPELLGLSALCFETP